MNTKELSFLKTDFIPLLSKVQPTQKGVWGKMDGQQMVEHFREVLKLANGKIILPLLNTDDTLLAKAREFMLSDKPFKENTKMPLLPEEPHKHKYATLEEAIGKVKTELQDLFTVYENDATKTTLNPMFGYLNYAEQVHLLYKHAQHHLRQFGLV